MLIPKFIGLGNNMIYIKLKESSILAAILLLYLWQSQVENKNVRRNTNSTIDLKINLPVTLSLMY